MRREKKKNKGFSLVELIIVIAIMVILGAIIAPQYFKHVKNANIASDIEQAARISAAISAEYATEQLSGDTTSDLDVYVPAAGATAATNEWVAVTEISSIVSTVQESKVEKGSHFYYQLTEDGDVQIGIGTSVTIATSHIISPLHADAAKWK